MSQRISERSASTASGSTQERPPPSFVLLTPKEVAARLRVSQSFLAKARMRGDGPPYVKSAGPSAIPRPLCSCGCGPTHVCRRASSSWADL